MEMWMVVLHHSSKLYIQSHAVISLYSILTLIYSDYRLIQMLCSSGFSSCCNLVYVPNTCEQTVSNHTSSHESVILIRPMGCDAAHWGNVLFPTSPFLSVWLHAANLWHNRICSLSDALSITTSEHWGGGRGKKGTAIWLAYQISDLNCPLILRNTQLGLN